MSALPSETWQDGLYRLLPTGQAWENKAGLLDVLTYSAAAELARLDMQMQVLGVNLNPLDADKLLSEWERDFALPDQCGNAGNITNRKQSLLTALTFNVTTTKKLVEEQAALYGLTVRVEEPSPNNVAVHLPAQIQTRFRCSIARCGTALLGIKSDTSFECRIKKQMPAQINLSFQYDL